MRLIDVQPPISFVPIRVHSWFKNTASFSCPLVSFVDQFHPPPAPCGSSVKIRVHPWRKKHPSSVANKTSVARTPTATNPYTCRPIDSHTRSLTIAAHCLSLQQQRNVIQPAQPLIRVNSWFKIRFLPVATPDHSPTVTPPHLCSI
jgi:hypothetical protein